ncbi:c-type cytochrome [Roseibacillus ishigakijimensis]|uniref:C-type cytochrome n=1 Tax=Roseibacillus ishigakijimensis TaxID=454146 RepID=A0A934VLQ7_9BACT|nr:c-type cytochrome [Roseibacillus ishigakijimensis]MBK1834934.1 c-type cytochrome [Roseibacillus ishigakijimensis]
MTKPQTFLLLLSLFASGPLAGDVLATYQQGDRHDRHLARLPALHVPAGTPATPLLEEGTFSVTWTGTLSLEKRQRLHFSFAGTGTATLVVAGEEVLQETGSLGGEKSDRLRLSGEVPIEVRYQSPEEGEARFQLLWEERSFPTEPIPPGAFTKRDGALAAEALAYRGREIFARHLCSKCHLAGEGFGPHAMPELNHVPPIVGLSGDRLQEDWLARWIADPAAYRPDTNMPRLVADSEEGRQAAADLAAYLMTLKTGAEGAPVAGDAQAGGATFHKLACVTCHGQPDESTPSENRLPLTHLADKYQPHALRDFLLDPAQLSPHTRMPNFRLSDEEAANLTAFLLEQSATAERPQVEFPAGDASKGAAHSLKMQCGACHAGLPYDPSALPPFETIAQKPWNDAPCFSSAHSHLNLPEDAGDALEALRSEHLDSLKRDTAPAFAERQFKNLRCHACHSRDEVPALLGALHSDTAALAAHLNVHEKLDQSLPNLTHTGAMLHSDALAEMLAGTAEPRPRPWLDARMPGFANHAPETFAQGLAAQHGLAPSTAQEQESDADRVAVGKELIGSESGFGCTTCHGVGDQEPTAAFEVMGINFALTHERLREDYFYRWMHNPVRITPDTKMPRYADDKGETPLPALGGESRAQFEAIWDYLQTQ